MILRSSLRVILSSGLRDPLREIILRHETSLFRLSLHLLLKALQRIHSRIRQEIHMAWIVDVRPAVPLS